MTENQLPNNPYESQTIDVDEIEGTDIKINPDFYIHMAILKAQEALNKDNMKEGLIQYRVIVEHIEGLVKAAKMLDDKYDAEVEAFKHSQEYIQEVDALTKSTLLAQKKFNTIMSRVFDKKTVVDSIKLS